MSILEVMLLLILTTFTYGKGTRVRVRTQLTTKRKRITLMDLKTLGCERPKGNLVGGKHPRKRTSTESPINKMFQKVLSHETRKMGVRDTITYMSTTWVTVGTCLRIKV